MSYFSLKTSFKHLLRREETLEIILDLIHRTHQLSNLVTLFLKLYLIDHLNDFPVIDLNFINTIYKIIGIKEDTRGRPTTKNLELEIKLKTYFIKSFQSHMVCRYHRK